MYPRFLPRHALAFLLLFASITSVEARTKTNLSLDEAIALYQNGEGDANDHERIYKAFTAAEKSGDARASFYLGRMHRLAHGTSLHFGKALRYFEECLKLDPEFKGAWTQIGQLYEEKGPGLKQNFAKAEAAFRKAVTIHEDADAYYGLYWMSWYRQISTSHEQLRFYQRKAAELGHARAAYSAGYQYFRGIRDPSDREKAAYFFELAHKNGHRGAAAQAGYCFDNAPDGGPPDYITAARFYLMAAELSDPKPKTFVNLGILANKPEVVEHYGTEETNRWKELRKQATEFTKEQAGHDVMQAKAAFDEGRLEEASTILKNGFDAWSERYDKYWNWEYAGRIWREAQTLTGRTDLEWGRFLFAWLADEVYARPDAFGKRLNHHETRIGVRTNLCGRLISLGRYGLLRQRTAETKYHITTVDGIVVDQVLATHSLNANYDVIRPEALPLHPAEHPGRIPIYSRPQNDILAAYTVEAMEPLSLEAISLGNWEAALIYAAWIERWITHIEDSGQIPNRDYPGYFGDIKEMPWALRARAFQALGLPHRAAEQYKSSIEAGITAYKSRALHRSHIYYANYLIDQGRAGEIDLENLETVETAMQDNRFAESHEWQFAKLARARALAATESFAAAKALIDDILDFTATTKLPLLRLETLLVASELHMDTGDHTPVEAWLSEALKWAREQGLLFEELRIYQHYVRHLIAAGNYQLALEMQRRVLDLINGLDVKPRRELALFQLAEIYALLNDERQTRTLLASLSDPAQRGRIEAILKDRQDTAIKGSNAPSLDLQPLRIVSAPLKNESSAIFVLSNPSPTPTQSVLSLRSSDFALRASQVSSNAIVLELTASTLPMNTSINLEVPSSSQIPLVVEASGLTATEALRSITLSLSGGSQPKSEWQVQSGIADAPVAVVDAAHIKDNPFYLIPVFHHISSRSPLNKTIALRTVASEPTRIECYNAEGRLLFVDAEGNGSFADPGDLVATELVQDMHPAIEVAREDRLIELRYQPLESGGASRIDIRIETREDGAEDAIWETNVIDWLQR